MAKKVLIAEDEAPLSDVLASRLKNLGYEVEVAADGADAIKRIKKMLPDLILLDIILPIKNGFDVLEEIRVKLNLQTPVMILSNLERDDDRETGENLGISHYLIKSEVSIREITALINELLSGSSVKSS